MCHSRSAGVWCPGRGGTGRQSRNWSRVHAPEYGSPCTRLRFSFSRSAGLSTARHITAASRFVTCSPSCAMTLSAYALVSSGVHVPSRRPVHRRRRRPAGAGSRATGSTAPRRHRVPGTDLGWPAARRRSSAAPAGHCGSPRRRLCVPRSAPASRALAARRRACCLATTAVHPAPRGSAWRPQRYRLAASRKARVRGLSLRPRSAAGGATPPRRDDGHRRGPLPPSCLPSRPQTGTEAAGPVVTGPAA